ncbi:MAG: sodium-dependent transporter [Planctomycetaceae bacterium]|nr:sodium-dependent transporter [Planctomycetaceae bacterium]
MKQHDGWASRIGVIMAVAGSAVGLGNFLRFPGQAAQHGGGAFMLPYFAALLLLGIPLCWAEWTMGRYGGTRGFHSAPGIFSVLWRHPAAKYFGVLPLLIPLVVYMYYVVIEAWCLGYAWNYLRGHLALGDRPETYVDYFNRYVGKQADGSLFAGDGVELLVTVGLVFTLNFVIIFRGLAQGIERFCNFALPLMAVLAGIVLVRVLTLGTPNPDLPGQNITAGLGFMWNPPAGDSWAPLLKPGTWIAAAGQIFFSLGVGFGIIINYSSYTRNRDDVVLSGLTAASMNEFFEVCLGGLITIPAAFVFLGASVAGMGTFGLGFNALPNVFARMPGGQFFGAMWFFMLFLAAVTSSIAMIHPVATFFLEGLGLRRRSAFGLLALIAAAGSGLVVYFSRDMLALDTMDFWVGSFLIVCLALFQSVLYGWIFGVERGEAEAHRGAHIRIPGVVRCVLKYVTPLYLIAMVAWFFVVDVVGTPAKPGYAATLSKSPVAQITAAFIAALAVLLLVMIHFAGRRWAARTSSPIAEETQT